MAFPAFVALATLTVLVSVMTFVPWVRVPHGIVRVCDFPRLQIVAATVLLIGFTLVLVPPLPALVLLAFQGAVVAVQGAVCLRYTPLARVQSLPFEGGSDDPAVVRILSANVKLSNDNPSRVIALLRERTPHVAILLEVDRRWLSALADLRDLYPVTIERPQDNTFGIALFSRLPLIEPEVRFLLMDEVPSIRATVVLPDGQRFRLHALHPEPPSPFEDTLGRDAELVLVAREVKADPMPTVVAGDLNDVAWSRTTRRFQRLSGLLDPRIGRGFFNSFDARYRLLRWPLDHLFHDSRFRLVHLERLKDIGSDHFPMLFELALTGSSASDEAPGPPDGRDAAEAHDVVGDARELDRRPVGADWEG